MRELLNRLLATREEGPPALERELRARFRFLEERQGFELAESRTLADGAFAGYANRPAGRAIAVFVRGRRGAWAGVGRLGEDGRLEPVNRDTLGRGVWREVRRIDLGEEAETLEDAVAKLAASLGGTDV